MADEKKVVDLAVEPTPQIDRTPPAADVAQPPEPSTEAPVTPEPIATEPAPISTVQPVNADVDEFGVPWKNRAMEYKRKTEDLVDRLPQMIEEKLSKVNKPQQPTYTFEQLEAYKLQNATDANIVAWATGEQRKIQQSENKRLFEEVVGSREKVNKVELQKQQSLSYVQNTYPEAFKRDAQGHPLSWDETNPLTQQIFGLMQNPDLANNPQGLAAAADIAYGRVARGQIPAIQQKVAQGKAELKQAQKASLTEGSGRRVTPSAPPQQVAIDNLRKTGSPKDAEQAIGAILRQKGIIVD
jgi:hypothetical protein